MICGEHSIPHEVVVWCLTLTSQLFLVLQQTTPVAGLALLQHCRIPLKSPRPHSESHHASRSGPREEMSDTGPERDDAASGEEFPNREFPRSGIDGNSSGIPFFKMAFSEDFPGIPQNFHTGRQGGFFSQYGIVLFTRRCLFLFIAPLKILTYGLRLQNQKRTGVPSPICSLTSAMCLQLRFPRSSKYQGRQSHMKLRTTEGVELFISLKHTPFLTILLR